MIAIRPVPCAEILRHAELLREYAAECSIPEIGQIQPQAAMYEAMERSGLMRTFAAYCGDELAGIASILLYVLPHYGEKVASLESIFVARRHRSKAIGRELMKTVENCARAEGCKAILYSAPAESRLERLLSLLRGYRRTNAVFTRRLV